MVRHHELSLLLDDLRGNIGSPSCQHILVVGPRGRGKTMLLARVAAELRSNDDFAASLLPVRFMEESQEIFSLTDFWLETMFHLATEIDEQDAGLARELRDSRGALAPRWREQIIEAHARATVLDAADRLGKQLVLIVENLQSLFRDVHDDFGWQLREVLQTEPQIILLGSATSRFRELDDVSEPFFEMFRIVGLEPLDTEECGRLWEVVSGKPASRSEVRPLQILTGGNPRLLVMAAEFARHRSLRRLMSELVTMIDEHTEYFRGHLEALAKTERRVYVAVSDLWQPSSASEVAARARVDIRVASTMLGRLVERGAVIQAGSRSEAPLLSCGAAVQHVLQAAARAGRGGGRREPDPVHGGVLWIGGFDGLRSAAVDRGGGVACPAPGGSAGAGSQAHRGRLRPGNRKWGTIQQVSYVAESLAESCRHSNAFGPTSKPRLWRNGTRTVVSLVDKYVARRLA